MEEEKREFLNEAEKVEETEGNKLDFNLDEIKNYHVENIPKLITELMNQQTPDININEKDGKEKVEKEKAKGRMEKDENDQKRQTKQEQKQEQKQKHEQEQKQQHIYEHEQKQEQSQERTNRNGKTVADDENIKEKYSKLPTIIIVIGMAGSGKTTYVGSLYNYLKVVKKKKVYTMNLDPAVQYIHYPANIDIRDSIKYREIMKEYKLGPNGAIMTCLNLFATRFDKVIELLEKRKDSLHYVIIDTPGQIEVFNWSASGNIILETLSVSFPVIINYVIDTVRCERPVTFMSNMLYACSVLYKSRLPLLACFNKIDIIKHDKCIEWMKNFDTFSEDVLNDVSYMASFSRSCALMINEFYEEIKTAGVSSTTNEGFHQILEKIEALKQEYIDEFVPRLNRQLRRIKRKKDKEVEQKMKTIKANLVNMTNTINMQK